MTDPHRPLQEGNDLSIELQPSRQHEIAERKGTYPTSVEEGQKQSGNIVIKDANEDLQTPALPAERQERWNYPRINMARTFVAFYGFVIMGLNDAAYGVRMPTFSVMPIRPRNILTPQKGPYTLCTPIALHTTLRFLG